MKERFSGALRPASAWLLLALLAGCSTPVPLSSVAWVQPAQAFASRTGPGDGEIVVVRDAGGGTGMRGCRHVITIDGREAAQLKPGEGVKVAAAAGPRVVHLSFDHWVCNSGEGAVSVEVRPGAATYLRTMTTADNRSQIAPAAPF
jgi:hypothetical protein